MERLNPDVATLPMETEAPGESPPGLRHEPGVRIGAYEVVRELGHGGMGAVYLAVRADRQYEQWVAIKVIKRGMDTEEIVRRFRRERQILANLQHPNIAGLMDGGATAEGMPYFVMEYIRGTPIHEYCLKNELGIRQRLELFRTVCSAVQYAHQNLVVHRDLKPGNILVTEAGEPKLLDFGLAKVLSPGAEIGEQPLTMAEDRLMTPEYASPEQALGERITTASDTYSLGVILYELLTFRRPYKITSRAPEEVARIISQSDPEKPSSAITRKLDTSPDPETHARVNPAKLRRALQGDLDNIVMMALRKEPQRRYSSVEALSQDIYRYLHAMPVLARKPTTAYRAGKFITRHRSTLAAATVLLLALVTFAIMMTVQSARLARERDIAAMERDRAEQVTSFLTDLFLISDPGEARGNSITAREILDKGAVEIESGLRDQPDVQAALLDTIGRVYQNLGLYDRANNLLLKALDIRKRQSGPGDPLVSDSLQSLAALRYDQGIFDEAEKLFRQSLQIREKLYGSESAQAAETLNGLALLYHSKGEYKQAETIYRKVLAIHRMLPAKDNPDVGTAVNNLALVLHDQGNLDKAEPLYRESLDIDRKAFGEVHPHVSRDLNNLASLLQDKKDYRTAEPLFRSLVALNRKLYGNKHPEVATAINNLGRILQDLGNTREAEALFREAVAMNRKLLGEDHPALLKMEHNLAVLLLETKRPAEAEPILRRILEKNREILGEDHPLVLNEAKYLEQAIAGNMLD